MTKCSHLKLQKGPIKVGEAVRYYMLPTRVGSFPSRNFGGRTAVMVRSVLQEADRHVF